MKKVITTVGTSLISNYLKENKTLNHYEIIKEKPSSEYENEKRRIEKIKNDLMNFARKKDNACAEITSINKIKEKYSGEELEIVLLASDTLDSIIVSEILEKIMSNNEVKVLFSRENSVVNSLRVDKKESFIKGINNLIDKIFNLIKKKDAVLKPKEVLFNITGGYKGTIPYFSTIAQIFDYEIVYTFEEYVNSKDIIEIKPLPVEIDRGMLELYYPYINDVNLINGDIKNQLIELGLYDGENLTPIGKIALFSVKNTPLSKDVFGHFMEYKVYEYFINLLFDKKYCECLGDFNLSEVKHGESLGKNLTDIDILLANDNNEIVWIEVKPVLYLIDKKKNDELKEQILNRQLSKLKNSPKFKNKKLRKYLLVVYGYSRDHIKNECIENLTEIFNSGNIDFDICYFEIKLAKSDKKEHKTITSATYHTVMKDFILKKLERITNV
jgi:hypothetical protein